MTTCLRIQLAPSWHHRRPAGIFKIVFSEIFHSSILVILFREYFMNVAVQELHQDSGIVCPNLRNQFNTKEEESHQKYKGKYCFKHCRQKFPSRQYPKNISSRLDTGKGAQVAVRNIPAPPHNVVTALYEDLPPIEFQQLSKVWSAPPLVLVLHL